MLSLVTTLPFLAHLKDYIYFEPTHCENQRHMLYYIYQTYVEWRKPMDTAAKIKELRESVGMNRKEFSEHTGIPVRTLEDWEAARRTPPEYIPRLIAYQLKSEQMIREKEE